MINLVLRIDAPIVEIKETVWFTVWQQSRLKPKSGGKRAPFFYSPLPPVAVTRLSSTRQL